LRLKIELDEQASAKLIEEAATEKRPVAWQAEVLLRKALGLSSPVRQEREDVELAAEEAC